MTKMTTMETMKRIVKTKNAKTKNLTNTMMTKTKNDEKRRRLARDCFDR